MPKTAAGIYLEVMNRGGNHDLPGLDKQTRAKVKEASGQIVLSHSGKKRRKKKTAQ